MEMPVNHDDDAVRSRVLGTERVKRRSYGGCLVVGGDEDGDHDRSAEDATGLGHHKPGGEQLHLGIGRAPGSVHDHPFDKGGAGDEDQTETDGADHDGEDRHLVVIDDVPPVEQDCRLRGLNDRVVASRHREPQQERPTDGDACDDQSDVAAGPGAGVTASGGQDIVVVCTRARRTFSPNRCVTSGVARSGWVGVVGVGGVRLRHGEPLSAAFHPVRIGRTDR